MVKNDEALGDEIDLEKTRRTMSGVIAKQRCAGVEAKLLGKFNGEKGPRGVNVTATIQMRTKRAEPRDQVARIA